ncbi:zinc finger protein 668 isoform X2 [Folsomia candida]|uniref:zinc finger protein 668 isoform X2 n=1 Tax=Folsomia candida TaxID=158441 RepID=UPI001604A63E|nr:zinc finger protein 668 isoform X2 [Folsomia candida]
MFFTCEIHNQHFSTLEAVKLHDSVFHIGEKDDNTTEEVMSVQEKKSPTDPSINHDHNFNCPIKSDNSMQNLSPPRYTCHICAETFPSSQLVMHHLKSHFGPQDVHVNQEEVDYLPNFLPVVKTEQSLDDCCDIIDSESDLYYEPESVTTPQLNNKPKASRSQKNKLISLRHHSSTHKRISCYFCSFVPRYSFFKLLEAHMRKHTLEIPYRCVTCGRRCYNSKKLEIHQQTRHQDSSNDKLLRKFKCRLCKRSFRAKDTLRGHMQTHSTHATLSCPHCEKRFKQGRALVRHIASCHSTNPLITCEVSNCGQTFNRRDVWKLHMKKVHPSEVITNSAREKSYTCQFCPRGTANDL